VRRQRRGNVSLAGTLPPDSAGIVTTLAQATLTQWLNDRHPGTRSRATAARSRRALRSGSSSTSASATGRPAR